MPYAPTSLSNRIRGLRRQYQRRTYAKHQSRRAFNPPAGDDTLCGPPDYVGLGAQKSGTTWWFRLIIQHPEIERPASWFKEVNFFEPFWDRPFTEQDCRLYHRHFPRRPGLLTGEWTPEYLFDPWAPACLHRAAPEAKLIVMLRDPVERYQSGLAHEVATGRRITLDDARHSFQRGLYLNQLANVLEHFRRPQLLVLQYEKCRTNPAEELRRTFEHLGVDPTFVPDDFAKTYNATEIPKPPLGPELADRLARAYAAPSLALVAEFPEIEPDLWPSFR